MSQCPNCEGYGIIEGRYCNCSLGQMAVRDALARGDHVAVAYNHQTGEKEVFRDMKHKPASAPSPEELAREIAIMCGAGEFDTDLNRRVAALLRARGERQLTHCPFCEERLLPAPPREGEGA